jgi:hypothetical protein
VVEVAQTQTDQAQTAVLAVVGVHILQHLVVMVEQQQRTQVVAEEVVHTDEHQTLMVELVVKE